MQYRERVFWSVVVIGLVSIGGLGADWRGIPDGREEKNALRKARDKAEPDYCRTDSKWEESRKKGGGGSSVVGGTGGGKREPIFFNHERDWDKFCGEGVQGLDPSFYDDDKWGGIAWGEHQKTASDTRVVLGYALFYDRIDGTIADEENHTDDLSDARAALFRAMLVHRCFAQTKWNAAASYPGYDWCRRRTRPSTLPSRSKVKKILEDKLPGKTFAHKNFLFMYDRGRKMRKKVVKGFKKFEKNNPIVKKIYRDGPKQGVKRYEQLRKDHPKIYETLDPITERLEQGEEPPKNCGAKLEKLQNKAAKQLEIEPTLQKVHDFRARHPLGRQLTEALAFCYSDDPKAKMRFNFEKELLDKAEVFQNIMQTTYGEYENKPEDQVWHNVPPAMITKMEHKAHARQRIYEKMKDKDGVDLPEFLGGTQVPDLEREWLVKERPEIKPQYEKDKPSEQLFRTAGKGFDKRGHYSDQFEPAPVIEKITDVPVGKQLTFPTKTEVREYSVCVNEKTLDRIDYIHYVNGKQEVVYETKCLESKMKEAKYERGAKPIVISGWETDHLEEGLQVWARSNSKAPEDSMVKDAWWPDKNGTDAPKILRGVLVNQ